ncbi:alpha/beta fold hydrolase [Caulobacter sp. 17J65-9]|nr:alpha/beta fold hydrolase [Caulobacter sp. 17J65-9]
MFYATHRKPTGLREPARYFGTEKGPLSYGKLTVSVPRDREVGEVSTYSVFSLEMRPDPKKHFLLKKVEPIRDAKGFFDGVRGRVSRSGSGDVVVFVHGFNTSFEGAALRTAQIAADLHLDGAPILYSWPSKANLFGYSADAAEAADEATLRDLAQFLDDVRRKTGAKRVHLVAHSMGNRLLARALAALAERPGAAPLFDEVVLAAPDVGVEEFDKLWPKLSKTGRRFTLYASRNDKALQVSRQVNGERRVGDAALPVVKTGLQTVDTSGASGGLLGHDDFAGTALDDFRAVLWLSLAPERRCVLKRTGGKTGWWLFGAGCPEAEFHAAMARVHAAGGYDPALAALKAELARAGTGPQAETLRRLARRIGELKAGK